MQAIEKMTNVQKARLLHELFPAEIPGFITYAASLCKTIIEQGDQLANRWDNPFVTVGYWLSLASTIGQRIHTKKQSVTQSSKVFSEQLFSNLDALLTIHCLQQYAQHDGRHPNRRFTVAIDLLFNPE